MPRSSKVFKKVRKCQASRCSKDNLKTSPIITNGNDTSTKKASASRRKIDSCQSLDDCGSDTQATSGFRLIDLKILSDIISSACVCADCGAKSLRLYDEENRIGIVCMLHLTCESCHSDTAFRTSASSNRIYEANMRLIYGMRCLGIGREGTRLFCGIMNMPQPSARYTTGNKTLLSALQEEVEENLKSSAKEAVKMNSELKTEADNTPDTDLCVSCDGTWMKRGHTSLYGVSSVISVDTGKILDVQVMSKYCYSCVLGKRAGEVEENKWQVEHKKVCCRNYSGSSGGMEPAAMKLMFHRSVEKYGVRYTKYLGDGDSSSFKTVLESEPYGPHCAIEKLECVGHVQKRMGGRLLKLKRELKGRKLEDGKLLGGPNRLTDKEIHSLQVYYGKAIRDNSGNLNNMQKAVWSIYFHKLSTDDKPVHNLCDISWCKFKQAERDGMNYSHKHSLPVAVLSAIKPTFRCLAEPDLLRKCVHGKTQNPNESYNSLIWKRCPKTTFVSTIIVEIAAYDACLVFNNGNLGRIKTLQRLRFHPGAFTYSILKDIDDKRVAAADITANKIEQQVNQRRQAKKRLLADEEEYAYGLH
ncbi:uncharacterized protein LOC124720179 [Schistocerca piceifrons]|uniref:uncharacterized protein LOC124720179 n=1 Tax=Schistocerca piceifrons TaxID=274613 RepID=UPI001F5F5FF1|nr:uncharacterized protein LOC124720179 [Schistocerca piceifrons]